MYNVNFGDKVSYSLGVTDLANMRGDRLGTTLKFKMHLRLKC